MEYPDLHTFPEGHPPSPYNSPALVVKIGDGSLPRGLELRVVGWLEKPGFLTGKVIDECLDALVVAHSEGKIFSDGHRGIHDCTLCGRGRPKIRWRGQTLDLLGHGHYLIQMKKTVYMAPELLLHYIRGHKYCPPQEFVEATIRGKFLTEEDLEIK